MVKDAENFQKVFLRCVLMILPMTAIAQTESARDQQVKKYLNERRDTWRDMNVPYQDGQLLYDLIVKNGYKSAVEIGTSTGHSTVWIAWALSKTGGKLITMEIDEGRRQQALDNLEACGLLDYVDSRLGDAHQLVKDLKGPVDFVFSDADKEWYTQYFKDLDPKLKVGGCFTAHNVRNNFGGTKDFLDYVRSQDRYETTVDKSSSAGVSISYKRK